MNERKTYEHFLKLPCTITAFLVFVGLSFAQPVLPPRSTTVTATQGIHFGTMALTGVSGGTVTVGYDGSRSSSGDIMLFSIPPFSKAAIFEIKLCEGRNITITFSATTTLTSSNGGTLTLDIGPTDKGGNSASFATNGDCNYITILRVGGTLHIPGTAIAGAYSGSFEITFNYQ